MCSLNSQKIHFVQTYMLHDRKLQPHNVRKQTNKQSINKDKHKDDT